MKRNPAQLSAESPRRIPAVRYLFEVRASVARGRRIMKSKRYIIVPSFRVKRTSRLRRAIVMIVTASRCWDFEVFRIKRA